MSRLHKINETDPVWANILRDFLNKFPEFKNYEEHLPSSKYEYSVQFESMSDCAVFNVISTGISIDESKHIWSLYKQGILKKEDVYFRDYGTAMFNWINDVKNLTSREQLNDHDGVNKGFVEALWFGEIDSFWISQQINSGKDVVYPKNKRKAWLDKEDLDIFAPYRSIACYMLERLGRIHGWKEVLSPL